MVQKCHDDHRSNKQANLRQYKLLTDSCVVSHTWLFQVEFNCQPVLRCVCLLRTNAGRLCRAVLFAQLAVTTIPTCSANNEVCFMPCMLPCHAAMPCMMVEACSSGFRCQVLHMAYKCYAATERMHIVSQPHHSTLLDMFPSPASCGCCHSVRCQNATCYTFGYHQVLL